ALRIRLAAFDACSPSTNSIIKNGLFLKCPASINLGQYLEWICERIFVSFEKFFSNDCFPLALPILSTNGWLFLSDISYTSVSSLLLISFEFHYLKNYD